MKSILPSFALWVAGTSALPVDARAQAPAVVGQAAPAAQPASAATPPGDSISGDALMRRVLAAVDAQPSIAARLRYKVDLMDRPSVGSGVYLQQGRGPSRQLRFELNLQTPGLLSRVRHVSDGTNLWIIDEIAGEKRLGRVDVSRLQRAKPKSLGAAPTADGWIALGGLPKLLSGLDATFDFGPVNENRLDDLRVWSLVGHWERSRLANLLPDQKQAIEAGQPVDLSKLSPQLPDTVVVHVGCDDFFPYRFEYWRSEETAKRDQAPGRGKLLVVMELYEVRLAGSIDPSEFVFRPLGDQKPIDRTGEFIERLGLEDATPSGASQRTTPRR